MGYSEKAVIISYVESVFTTLYALVYIIVMIVLLAGVGIISHDEELAHNDKTVFEIILLVVFLIFGVLLGLTIYFAVILHKGVRQQDVVKLNRWFKFHAVIWIICVVAEVGSIFTSTLAKAFGGLVFLAYRAVALFVVRKYISELIDDEGIGKMDGVRFQQEI